MWCRGVWLYGCTPRNTPTSTPEPSGANGRQCRQHAYSISRVGPSPLRRPLARLPRLGVPSPLHPLGEGEWQQLTDRRRLCPNWTPFHWSPNLYQENTWGGANSENDPVLTAKGHPTSEQGGGMEGERKCGEGAILGKSARWGPRPGRFRTTGFLPCLEAPAARGTCSSPALKRPLPASPSLYLSPIFILSSYPNIPK